jgi:oligopeptide/dipeptide ABC transporter ATP-binding protein
MNTDRISVAGLSVVYGNGLHAVNGVTFSLPDGASLGLVGESGCGKSTLTLALLSLLPAKARVSQGSIVIGGKETVGADAATLRRMRWRELAWVPQGAASALSPVSTIFSQFVQTWRAHGEKDLAALRRRAEQLFADVELPAKWLDAYPHQLSGGMRQRVIIALSLLFSPKLLLADEPTTGLDVIVQKQVIETLKRLQQTHGATLVFVSHDIGVVADLCRDIAVMYAGQIVEMGSTAQTLAQPLHPYTIALRQSFPDIRHPEREIVSIPGRMPALTAPPTHCSFADRCPFARERCRSELPRLRALDGRQVACHYAEEAPQMREQVAQGQAWAGIEAAAAAAAGVAAGAVA